MRNMVHGSVCEQTLINTMCSPLMESAVHSIQESNQMQNEQVRYLMSRYILPSSKF